MKTKRVLKSPFVVTLSTLASASIIACGGSGDEGTSADQNLTEGNGGPTMNPPPPPACPSAMPEHDQACGDVAMSCNYDDTGCQFSFECDPTSKKWVDMSPSCNPPMPEVQCPEKKPTEGAACGGEGSCDYDTDTSCQTTLSCDWDTMKWVDNSPTCNPSMPQP